MHYNQYNNIPMGIGAVLARNPEARRNFALASQEEQTALIDSCTHCNSYEEMCDIVNSQATQNQLQESIRWSYFYITLQNDFNYSLIAVTTPEPTV